MNKKILYKIMNLKERHKTSGEIQYKNWIDHARLKLIVQ